MGFVYGEGVATIDGTKVLDDVVVFEDFFGVFFDFVGNQCYGYACCV